MERKEARILVIDDEPMMADSLKQNLAEEGYSVDTAATGAEELGGDFDAAAMTEAFKTITSSALALGPADAAAGLSISLAPGAGGQSAIVEWRGVKAMNGDDPFHSFAGSEGLRLSLAAKIIEAHGGKTNYGANTLSAELPLDRQ